MPCARSAEKTLVVELKDDYAELTLKQYYTVFMDSDVIAVRQELVNNGKNDVSVLRLMSLQLDVSGTSHNCVSFSGAWARERFRKDTVVRNLVHSKHGRAVFSHIKSVFYAGTRKRRRSLCF